MEGWIDRSPMEESISNSTATLITIRLSVCTTCIMPWMLIPTDTKSSFQDSHYAPSRPPCSPLRPLCHSHPLNPLTAHQDKMIHYRGVPPITIDDMFAARLILSQCRERISRPLCSVLNPFPINLTPDLKTFQTMTLQIPIHQFKYLGKDGWIDPQWKNRFQIQRQH